MKVNRFDDVLASIILLAEDTEVEQTRASINNILQQIHENFELIVCASFDFTELKEKFKNNWKVSFRKSEQGVSYINEIASQAKGEFIFYKTVTNVLWFPRHIQAHIEELKQNKKCKWSLSHIEYRDVDNPDHPLNTIGFRIENPPPLDRIIVDEICHHRSIKIDWEACIVERGGQKQFDPSEIVKKWAEQELAGVMPKEITIAQWIKFGGEQEGEQPPDIEKQIGRPSSTELKEENKLVNGNIEVVRSIPTVMGNSFLDEEYNNSIRGIISTTEGITSIGLKRTIGMGDIIICEPIIKKLKQLYPEAKLTFFTAKPDVVKHFKNEPNEVVKIDENALLQDSLAESDCQIKFDLDLAYESRVDTPFIDAYAAVCGIEWDDWRDKIPQFSTPAEDASEYLPKEPYVVMVGDGSGWIGKTWSPANYENIVRFLNDKNYAVVEPGFGASSITDPKYNKCSLDNLVALIANCAFYIGTDNGPMHIASALNKPRIIIAGAALPYISNPNRENVFYIQDNSLECLGCKHKTFFSRNGNSLTFVPTCVNENQGVCMKAIGVEHVKEAIEKFTAKPGSILSGGPTNFYFNIPGYAYYREEDTDLIQRENPEEHPDQTEDLHKEYSERWEQVFNDYSVPFVETVYEEMEKKLSGMQSGLKFLDIGCSIGLVVKAAQEKGFDARGIDINEASIKKGEELFSDLDLICCSYKDLESWDHRTTEEDNTYDIIVCNQTLEHLSNPKDFLDVCSTVLRDDGLLFIGCPSFDEKDARNKWHKWQTMGKGEHTWIPTNKSFEWLMKKAGFEYEHLQDTEKGIFVKAWKA